MSRESMYNFFIINERARARVYWQSLVVACPAGLLSFLLGANTGVAPINRRICQLSMHDRLDR